MSTATSEIPRIPIHNVRRNDLIEIADYSELWLKVSCVHHLATDHCYRIDGTVYDRDRRQRDASIDFPDTEQPRRAPTPAPLTIWAGMRGLISHITQQVLRR